MVVANDTFISPASAPLHLVTGPNMCGKSTYLKQVGLRRVACSVRGKHSATVSFLPLLNKAWLCMFLVSAKHRPVMTPRAVP